MANIMKYLVTLTVIITLCNGSAIPMWEYLSRSEKMSHLYSTFAKQVSQYCKSRGDAQPALCKRELLMFGLGKLHDMDESHLDSMDPYQRGASDIIWDSMMDGHPNHSKKSITTPSSILESTGQFKRNPLFDDKPKRRETIPHKATPQRPSATDKYDDMELSIYSGAYAEPLNFINQEPTNINVRYVALPSINRNTIYNSDKPNYLTGPMVVRVRPDGTPVEEDRKQPLPRDDDRDEMRIGHQKLPTMEQIAEIYKIDSTATVRRGSIQQGGRKYSTYSPSGYKNYHTGERVYNLN